MLCGEGLLISLCVNCLGPLWPCEVLFIGAAHVITLRIREEKNFALKIQCRDLETISRKCFAKDSKRPKDTQILNVAAKSAGLVLRRSTGGSSAEKRESCTSAEVKVHSFRFAGRHVVLKKIPHFCLKTVDIAHKRNLTNQYKV